MRVHVALKTGLLAGWLLFTGTFANATSHHNGFIITSAASDTLKISTPEWIEQVPEDNDKFRFSLGVHNTLKGAFFNAIFGLNQDEVNRDFSITGLFYGDREVRLQVNVQNRVENPMESEEKLTKFGQMYTDQWDSYLITAFIDSSLYYQEEYLFETTIYSSNSSFARLVELNMQGNQADSEDQPNNKPSREALTVRKYNNVIPKMNGLNFDGLLAMMQNSEQSDVHLIKDMMIKQTSWSSIPTYYVLIQVRRDALTEDAVDYTELHEATLKKAGNPDELIYENFRNSDAFKKLQKELESIEGQ